MGRRVAKKASVCVYVCVPAVSALQTDICLIINSTSLHELYYPSLKCPECVCVVAVSKRMFQINENISC